MQAQNDLMALLARKEISIVSTEDSIEIIAKKRVTINGGGSYITLNASGIESATAGEYRTRAGYYVRREKAQHKPDIAPLANAINDGSHNIRYLCTDDNGVPMMNTPYRAFLADGSVLEGVSDGEGYTEVVYFCTDTGCSAAYDTGGHQCLNIIFIQRLNRMFQQSTFFYDLNVYRTDASNKKHILLSVAQQPVTSNYQTQSHETNDTEGWVICNLHNGNELISQARR